MRVLYFSRGYTPHDHRFLAALAGTGNEIHFLPMLAGGRGQDERPLPQGIRPHSALVGGEGSIAARLPRAISRLKARLNSIRPRYRPIAQVNRTVPGG